MRRRWLTSMCPPSPRPRSWRVSSRVVDVRSPGEFAEGHVPGAVNQPFAGRLSEGKPSARLQARRGPRGPA